jgi:hypothetical protein
MKTKMNFTCICCTLSAFVMCLSSTEGQTLGNEELMGTGYEPVVNCDRIVDPRNLNKRIQFVWMDPYLSETTQGIYWAISHNLGVTWEAPVVFPAPGMDYLDPLAVCDIWSTGTTREMYFGWFDYTIGTGGGDRFQRSPSGTTVDQSSVMYSPGGERPWLAANTASLYLSIGANASVEQAAIPSVGRVHWSDSAIQVFTADPNTALIHNCPVATHRDTAAPPNEQVFLMEQEYGTSSGTNFIRIRRSTNKGVNWSDDIQRVNVDGADYFVSDRDYHMADYHMVCDPNTSPSVNRVYAFYVRNEAAPYLQDGGRRNVLYCTASLDGGDTWGNPVMVYTISQSDLPPNGFATVPPNSMNNTDGFYRIGRVWSCVDNNGNVYVAWMDNRYGKFGTTDKDYWHVFCAQSTSTDQGQTWSAPIQVSGSTSDPLHTASIGGYGPARGDWVPPGDFLTCDADYNTLYVAWPDSRADQSYPNALTNVYFRSVQFP